MSEPPIHLWAQLIREPKGRTLCQVAPGCENSATHYVSLPDSKVLVPACVDCLIALHVRPVEGVDDAEMRAYTRHGETTERG